MHELIINGSPVGNWHQIDISIYFYWHHFDEESFVSLRVSAISLKYWRRQNWDIKKTPIVCNFFTSTFDRIDINFASNFLISVCWLFFKLLINYWSIYWCQNVEIKYVHQSFINLLTKWWILPFFKKSYIINYMKYHKCEVSHWARLN